MILLAVDTTAVIISAIGAAGTLALGVITLLLKKDVNVLKTEADGKLSLLLKETAAANLSKGIEEGRAIEKEEGVATAEKVVKAIIDNPDVEIKKNGH